MSNKQLSEEIKKYKTFTYLIEVKQTLHTISANSNVNPMIYTILLDDTPLCMIVHSLRTIYFPKPEKVSANLAALDVLDVIYDLTDKLQLPAGGKYDVVYTLGDNNESTD